MFYLSIRSSFILFSYFFVPYAVLLRLRYLLWNSMEKCSASDSDPSFDLSFHESDDVFKRNFDRILDIKYEVYLNIPTYT